MSTSTPVFAGDLPSENFNLARYCLASSALKYPQKTALIVCSDSIDLSLTSSWDYGEFENAVLCLTSGIRSLGLERGARIFIRMGNSVDYALVFFAANAAGFVPIPASSQLTECEVGYLIDDSQSGAVFDDGTLEVPDLPAGILHLRADNIARLKQFPRGNYAVTDKDDPAFMIYTSGTTSKPKGVLHAQRAVWGRRPMYKGWYDISENDVLLHTGAFNWTYTLGTGLFDPFANGATSIVYTGEKDITVWPKIIDRFKPTIMAGVPTLYRQILKYCEFNQLTFKPLRHCLTAGEPLPQRVQSQWLEKTGLALFEALGMSEISTYISSCPAEKTKLGSPGKPQNGRCIAVLPNEGGNEPVARGKQGVLAVHRSDPGLMKGYWNRLDEEAQVFRGDWFITGDLARMDEDGFIWFAGRNDDLMNVMGFRVSPVEIENALNKHRFVDQVGVCSLSVGDDVEVITAFIVTTADAPDLTDHLVTELEAFCRKKLAAYKMPKKYVFVDELPRNYAGKVMRKKLVKFASS